jgi:p-hydroxybenzoate 3-monooxygenase
MRTQVGIVGAGPAGLLLSHLLARQGIESVVLESRSRDYVEQRVRAGVLEQTTVELLREHGLGERMDRQGLVHEGIELRFDGAGHRIDFADLTGRSITVYGQQEVVKDIIAARLADGGRLLFETKAVGLDGLDDAGSRPRISYEDPGGEPGTLECDVVAGCDGFWGISREAVPEGVLTTFERTYPFAWLGILAEVAPSSEELIYCSHERGFALHSMRSPKLTRLYLQVDPDEQLDDWPDERIWKELKTRLATDDGWTLRDGPIVEKGITPMRSFVVEPMRHGRLFLAGDAAHIVPPTGAKGMNLAMNDVRVLADGLAAWYSGGDEEPLDAYTATCLRRVWRAQHFSWWMTSMLHRFPDDDRFQRRLQVAQLAWVTSSRAAATGLAENYTGMVGI